MRKLLVFVLAAVFTFGGVLAAQQDKAKDKAAAPQGQTEQAKEKKADDKSAKKSTDAPAAPAEKAAPKK